MSDSYKKLCPGCKQQMTLLLYSFVCDTCDPPAVPEHVDDVATQKVFIDLAGMQYDVDREVKYSVQEIESEPVMTSDDYIDPFVGLDDGTFLPDN